MMREELQKRLEHQLEDWQWEMAHEVYQNHPAIKDVGGKDQLARVIACQGGFGYGSVLWDMYKAIGGKPLIVKTVRELFTTYDVTHEHLCINSRGNLLKDIFHEVQEQLEKKNRKLLEGSDYFSLDSHDPTEVWDDSFDRLAVFYVKGGSEGYYVHTEILKRESHRCIFLGKTLREGEAGVSWAEQMVAALSRIMQV